MRHFSRLGGFAAFLAVVAAGALPARADATSPLETALRNTLNQPSYHIKMVTANGDRIEGDIVNPGRMHMVMKNTETIVVDRTMYMKMNGAWRKFPGVDIMNTQNPLQRLAAARGKFSGEDIGMKLIGGVPLHAYRVTNLATKKVDMVFVDGSGRIARVEAAKSVIEMSNFGEHVAIQAPI